MAEGLVFVGDAQLRKVWNDFTAEFPRKVEFLFVGAEVNACSEGEADLELLYILEGHRDGMHEYVTLIIAGDDARATGGRRGVFILRSVGHPHRFARLDQSGIVRQDETVGISRVIVSWCPTVICQIKTGTDLGNHPGVVRSALEGDIADQIPGEMSGTHHHYLFGEGFSMRL
jgi:hypothetical protein